MSELRKEPVSRRWVLIAPERQKKNGGKEESSISDSDKCPFCKGNEDMTPDEIERWKLLNESHSEWDIRVIPDKHALFGCENTIGRKGLGIYDVMNPLGHHELVVETSVHGETWWHYDLKRMTKLLQIYRDRFITFKKEKNIIHAVVTKSHGTTEGHSLHSHSHLLGLPFIVKRVEEEIKSADEYFRMKDRCIYCDILCEEINVGARIVYENDDFIVFAPFASRFQFEMWIAPKKHKSDYAEAKDSSLRLLADAFMVLCKKLNYQLGNYPFSLVLHTSPFKMSGSEAFHWHWELKPTSVDMAGFEWATGLYMNKYFPEEAAELLRKAHPESL